MYAHPHLEFGGYTPHKRSDPKFLEKLITNPNLSIFVVLDAVSHKVVTENIRRPFNVASSALALTPVQEKPAETGEWWGNGCSKLYSRYPDS